MNPLMAKSKSLQNLMGEMDDEQLKKVPGLTIEIIAGPGMNSAQDADDSQGQENPEEEEIENALGELQYHGMNPEEMDQNPVKDMTGNMFEDLIRKKKMGMIK